MREQDDLAWIATVFSQPEAACIASLLDAYGIFSYAANYVSPYPQLVLGLGGIRIFVLASELEDALDLLRQSDSGWSAPPPSYADNSLLNAGVAIGLFCIAAVAPPPRARGEYRWLAEQAKA